MGDPVVSVLSSRSSEMPGASVPGAKERWRWRRKSQRNGLYYRTHALQIVFIKVRLTLLCFITKITVPPGRRRVLFCQLIDYANVSRAEPKQRMRRCGEQFESTRMDKWSQRKHAFINVNLMSYTKLSVCTFSALTRFPKFHGGKGSRHLGIYVTSLVTSRQTHISVLSGNLSVYKKNNLIETSIKTLWPIVTSTVRKAFQL